MANFKDLKERECLSEIQYYVVEKKVGNKVQLKNDFGESIVVDSAYVDKCLISASEIKETKTINKTEAATIFLANPSIVMTVVYNKQVKDTDVVKEVMDKISTATIAEIEKAVKAGIKKAITGVERKIVGRHFGELNELGRVNFVDMEIDKDDKGGYDSRLRQVDPRTIKSMIIKGTEYKIK